MGVKWKLVAFSTDSDDHMRPTTYTTPERSIDSYRHIVDDLIGDPENAQVVWDDLNRVGARYSEWSYVTFVLVSYEVD
ncbi:MAG: hypothetical protein WCY71_12305 [Halothiobacillaceae bacterium]